MIKSLCAAGLALATASSMAATTVDVTFTDTGYASYSGSFVATDTNGDGIIETGEVSSFTTSLGASNLSAFGDYDIADNTWSTTPVGDYYYFATAGTHTLALTSGDDVTTTQTSLVSSVPEPANAAMLGLGSLALLAFRARQARRSA